MDKYVIFDGIMFEWKNGKKIIEDKLKKANKMLLKQDVDIKYAFDVWLENQIWCHTFIEKNRVLFQTIRRLSKTNRNIIYLYKIKGYTLETVSKQLNINIRTINRYYSKIIDVILSNLKIQGV